MSRAGHRSAAELFDSPILSDVIIKQISKGKVREYRAHKAILSADSSYFLRAFTGEFLEASQSVMEIHDDDPDHFELLLKYIYTYEYDKAAIDKLAGDDQTKRVLLPIGIHAVADKYDVPCIYDSVTEDLRSRLGSSDDNGLMTVIEAYYSTMIACGGTVGELITSVVLQGDRHLMHTEKYRELIIAKTVFGADMALALGRDTVDHVCRWCNQTFIVRREALQLGERNHAYCSFCQNVQTVL